LIVKKLEHISNLSQKQGKGTFCWDSYNFKKTKIVGDQHNCSSSTVNNKTKNRFSPYPYVVTTRVKTVIKATQKRPKSGIFLSLVHKIDIKDPQNTQSVIKPTQKVPQNHIFMAPTNRNCQNRFLIIILFCLLFCSQFNTSTTSAVDYLVQSGPISS
jgi:hypothetical protein